MYALMSNMQVDDVHGTPIGIGRGGGGGVSYLKDKILFWTLNIKSGFRLN